MTFYSKIELIQFLRDAFDSENGVIYKNGKDIQVICPFCRTKNKSLLYNKQKLSIHLEYPFITHCWVCGHSSKTPIPSIKTYKPHLVKLFIEKFLSSNKEDIEKLISENRHELEEYIPLFSLDHFKFDKLLKDTAATSSSTSEEKKIEIKLPDDFQLLASISDYKLKTNSFLRKYRVYLENRGAFNKKNLWYWKFGISSELKNRIIIPSFDKEGDLNYWTARTIIPNIKPPYQNAHIPKERIIFNEINIDWSKELILVEGPFDLIKSPVENSTCLLGSELSTKFKLFQKIIEHNTPVVLALDPDALEDKTLKIAKNLISYGINVRVATVPKPHKDPGSMNKKQFMEMLKNATVVKHDNEQLLSYKIRSIMSSYSSYL